MQNVSVIKNHHKVIHNTSLKEIYGLIKNPQSPHRQAIEEIRQLYVIGSAKQADDLKKDLMGFTVSGIFNKRRIEKNLSSYSGMLILDIDDLDPRQVNEVMERAKFIAYTYMAFISPSGFGVKIIVKINSAQQYHKTAYAQVVSYYRKEIGDITG